MSMIKFAIDLTWVRHKIVGGTETFVNNLIQGFLDTEDSFEMCLITASDNYTLFEKYTKDQRVRLLRTSAVSSIVWKRILWQNFSLNSFLRRNDLSICLVPVYSKPLFTSQKIKFITVIHDLEAIHLPHNHSIILNIWLRLNWRNSAKTSDHVIAISDFVREDIIKRYKISREKITTIYDPIIIDNDEVCEFEKIEGKYNVKANSYYYTVSKLNPHKNLTTIVKVVGEIHKRNIDLPTTLVVSGVDGGQAAKMKQIASDYGIDEKVIFTGFVENDVRNGLYANARAFLFPSVFEGFGMPLVEAFSLGTAVVCTTKCCMPEVTQHLANYVNDPFSVEEWIEVLRNVVNKSDRFDLTVYKPENIAKQYLCILNKVEMI